MGEKLLVQIEKKRADQWAFILTKILPPLLLVVAIFVYLGLKNSAQISDALIQTYYSLNPSPTPRPTATITPTPTLTLTPTITLTPTSTVTPTSTITLTPLPTPMPLVIKVNWNGVAAYEVPDVNAAANVTHRDPVTNETGLEKGKELILVRYCINSETDQYWGLIKYQFTDVYGVTDYAWVPIPTDFVSFVVDGEKEPIKDILDEHKKLLRECTKKPSDPLP